MLGWQDVRQRYRRSTLGPFWLTLSMGIMIGTLGVVFGTIFQTPMHDFFPFLTIGLILWDYISTTVNDGCTGFIASESIIRQLPLPLFTHILRLVWSHTITLAHNIILLPIVLIIVGRTLGLESLWAVPGFLILVLNLTWMALILAVICARYRDLPQIVASLLMVAFYVTPIIWMPGLMAGRGKLYLINVNPVYHILELVRAPLMGQAPTALNWLVSIGILCVGWLVTLALYGRYKSRIAYWL